MYLPWWVAEIARTEIFVLDIGPSRHKYTVKNKSLVKLQWPRTMVWNYCTYLLMIFIFAVRNETIITSLFYRHLRDNTVQKQIFFIHKQPDVIISFIGHYGNVTWVLRYFKSPSVWLVHTGVKRKNKAPNYWLLCGENPPVTGEVPPHRASNAEKNPHT